MGYYENQGIEKKRKRFDTFFFGFLVATALPIIVMVLLLLKMESSLALEQRFLALFHDILFVKYMTMALMPNLFLFFYFYKVERWKASSGLIVATVLYMMLFLIRL